MNKSAKNNQQTQLKSHSNQSHNLDSRLIALVKFMARRAAEEDYKTKNSRKNNQDIEGGTQ